jgi:GT2 family glycosyltransferase
MMKFFHLRGFINGIGNQIWPHGWGTDNFIGHIDIGQFDGLTEVPSACFGAVFLRREVLEDIGLLDEKYGSFYEDVDWSYRCWLRGWNIVPQPEAIVYHKFGGTYLARPKLMLTARNRLRLVLKIFQGKQMLGTLRRYMTEDIRNFLQFLKQKNFGFAMAYPEAYLSLALGLGNVLRERRRFRKRKLSGLRELDVLRKNIPFYHCLDPRGFPQLNVSVLLGCYRWELSKMRKDGRPEGSD